VAEVMTPGEERPMSVSVFLQTIGSTPAFATRPFMAILFLSGLGRYAAERSQLTEPSWLFRDDLFALLCILALIELAAHFDKDARLFINEVHTYVKPMAQFAVTLPMVDAQSVAVFQHLATILPTTPGVGIGGLVEAFSWLSHLVAIVWTLFVAAVTWYLTTLRNAVLGLLTDVDEDDTIGLGGVIHWFETVFAGVAAVVAIIAMWVALVGFLITLGTLWAIPRIVERREKRAMITCQGCGGAMHPPGLACPQCRRPNPQPRRVGVFGQAKQAGVADAALHQLELVARKRCYVCATRLKARGIQQVCPSCGEYTFADQRAAEHYVGWLGKKVPLTLVIVTLLGFIPVVGLIPAVIYYRLNVIAPLRAYVPRSVGCLTTWLLRIVTLFLVAFQVLPGAGGLAVPVIFLLNYGVYRQLVLSSARGLMSHGTFLAQPQQGAPGPQPAPGWPTPAAPGGYAGGYGQPAPGMQPGWVAHQQPAPGYGPSPTGYGQPPGGYGQPPYGAPPGRPLR
jgi:hypothetical protein